MVRGDDTTKFSERLGSLDDEADHRRKEPAGELDLEGILNPPVPAILGDQSGYIVDLTQLARSLTARGWIYREMSEPKRFPGDNLPRPELRLARKTTPDRFEVYAYETGEVVGVSDEAPHDHSMGVLAALIGELLPEDEYHEIVSLRPGFRP